MRSFDIRGRRKLVLGMIHLRPLPGTPFYEKDSLGATLDAAVRSAYALQEGGADGCLVQTVDRVYSVSDEADPARTAALALIVRAIARETDEQFQIGVQVMRNALKASLAIATVAGGTFIRAGALVGATLTAYGLVEPDPLSVMEYRTRLEAQDVKVIADIASMHFSWFGNDKPVAEVARDARYVGADAVCLGAPDEAVTLSMIASVREAVSDTPIILAGYTDHDNAARLLAAADGAFVGTCLERAGWGGTVDADRTRAYVDIVRGLE